MLELMKRFWKDEEGQDLVEYALIVALIALAIVGTFRTVGDQIVIIFRNIVRELGG